MNPKSAGLKLLLAQSLDAQGRNDEVETVLESAALQHPNLPETNLSYGLWLQTKGVFDLARIYLARSLEVEPNQGMAYLGLVKCGRLESSSRYVQAMEECFAKSGLDPLQRSYLAYAVGRVREDSGDFEASMAAYDEANRLCMSLRPETQRFDKAAHSESRQRIRSYFNLERMRTNLPAASLSERAIFIVGMPRSGTTLLEQMVSRHSKVGAAGELPFWLVRAGSIFDKNGQIDPNRARGLAAEYDSTLVQTAGDMERVTDKMPLNYLQLGYIRLLAPGSKVVYLRRNAADNCLSLYTTDYRTPPEFAHRRENIVHAYREHERLMAHWREVLPTGWMLEVDYESLVDEPEKEISRVLEFCELGFEPECLHPEANDRPIRTPSLWQARQPVNRHSIGRWKRFEPWLGEIGELVGRGGSEIEPPQ